MSVFKRGLATAISLAAMAWLSQLSWGNPPQHGQLRLSWRMNGEEIKVPRQQDPNLPAHMRLPEGQAFDSRTRPYRLQVRLDQQGVVDRRVESPGLRHDRPLSVFQEFTVAPGRHELEVIFAPERVEGAPAPQPSTAYKGSLDFEAGKVNLLTLDAEGAWLVKP